MLPQAEPGHLSPRLNHAHRPADQPTTATTLPTLSIGGGRAPSSPRQLSSAPRHDLPTPPITPARNGHPLHTYASIPCREFPQALNDTTPTLVSIDSSYPKAWVSTSSLAGGVSKVQCVGITLEGVRCRREKICGLGEVWYCYHHVYQGPPESQPHGTQSPHLSGPPAITASKVQCAGITLKNIRCKREKYCGPGVVWYCYQHVGQRLRASQLGEAQSLDYSVSPVSRVSGTYQPVSQMPPESHIEEPRSSHPSGPTYSRAPSYSSPPGMHAAPEPLTVVPSDRHVGSVWRPKNYSPDIPQSLTISYTRTQCVNPFIEGSSCMSARRNGPSVTTEWRHAIPRPVGFCSWTRSVDPGVNINFSGMCAWKALDKDIKISHYVYLQSGYQTICTLRPKAS